MARKPMAPHGNDVHRELVARVTQGEGTASPALRGAAFDNTRLDDGIRELVAAVARHPAAVTEEHFAAARRTGLSEDQLWELVICAAVGQASRQYQAGLASLGAALSEEGR